MCECSTCASSYPFGPPYNFCFPCAPPDQNNNCAPQQPFLETGGSYTPVDEENYGKELHDVTISFYGATVGGGAGADGNASRCKGYPADPGPLADPNGYAYTDHCWVHGATASMVADPAGNIVSYAGWDEAHAPLQSYSAAGQVQATIWPDPMDPWLTFGCSGNGPLGGCAVAADLKFIYTSTKSQVDSWHAGRDLHPCEGVARWTNNLGAPNASERINPAPFGAACGAMSNIWQKTRIESMVLCGAVLHVSDGTPVVTTLDTSSIDAKPKNGSWTAAEGACCTAMACGKGGNSVFAVSNGTVYEYSGVTIPGNDYSLNGKQTSSNASVRSGRPVMAAPVGLRTMHYDVTSNALITSSAGGPISFWDAETGQHVADLGSFYQNTSYLYALRLFASWPQVSLHCCCGTCVVLTCARNQTYI